MWPVRSSSLLTVPRLITMFVTVANVSISFKEDTSPEDVADPCRQIEDRLEGSPAQVERWKSAAERNERQLRVAKSDSMRLKSHAETAAKKLKELEMKLAELRGILLK